jgi:hypothetical protein
MNLPWFQTSNNTYAAYTLIGRVSVRGGTFPPAYLLVSNQLVGYSVYIKNKRVSWTGDLATAIGVATQLVVDQFNKKRVAK